MYYSSKVIITAFLQSASPHALRLLCGCCSVATRRHCCACRRRVLRTEEQGGRGRPCKHMMDVTGVEFSWACLSAKKETLETFKFREYHTSRTQSRQNNQIFRRLSADDRNTMQFFFQIMAWRFTREDLAEPCFPSC